MADTLLNLSSSASSPYSGRAPSPSGRAQAPRVHKSLLSSLVSNIVSAFTSNTTPITPPPQVPMAASATSTKEQALNNLLAFFRSNADDTAKAQVLAEIIGLRRPDSTPSTPIPPPRFTAPPSPADGLNKGCRPPTNYTSAPRPATTALGNLFSYDMALRDGLLTQSILRVKNSEPFQQILQQYNMRPEQLFVFPGLLQNVETLGTVGTEGRRNPLSWLPDVVQEDKEMGLDIIDLFSQDQIQTVEHPDETQPQPADASEPASQRITTEKRLVFSFVINALQSTQPDLSQQLEEHRARIEADFARRMQEQASTFAAQERAWQLGFNSQEEQTASLRAEMSTLREQAQRTSDTLDSTQTDLTRIKSELKQEKAARLQAEQAAQRAREETETATTSQQQQQAQISDLQTQTREMEALRRQLAALQQQATEREQLLEQKDVQLKDLTEKNTLLTTENLQLHEELRIARTTIEKQAAKIALLTQQIQEQETQFNLQLAPLHQQLSELATANQALQLQLEARRQTESGELQAFRQQLEATQLELAQLHTVRTENERLLAQVAQVSRLEEDVLRLQTQLDEKSRQFTHQLAKTHSQQLQAAQRETTAARERQAALSSLAEFQRLSQTLASQVATLRQETTQSIAAQTAQIVTQAQAEFSKREQSLLLQIAALKQQLQAAQDTRAAHSMETQAAVLAAQRATQQIQQQFTDAQAAWKKEQSTRERQLQEITVVKDAAVATQRHLEQQLETQTQKDTETLRENARLKEAIKKLEENKQSAERAILQYKQATDGRMAELTAQLSKMEHRIPIAEAQVATTRHQFQFLNDKSQREIEGLTAKLTDLNAEIQRERAALHSRETALELRERTILEANAKLDTKRGMSSKLDKMKHALKDFEEKCGRFLRVLEHLEGHEGDIASIPLITTDKLMKLVRSLIKDFTTTQGNTNELILAIQSLTSKIFEIFPPATQTAVASPPPHSQISTVASRRKSVAEDPMAVNTSPAQTISRALFQAAAALTTAERERPIGTSTGADLERELYKLQSPAAPAQVAAAYSGPKPLSPDSDLLILSPETRGQHRDGQPAWEATAGSEPQPDVAESDTAEHHVGSVGSPLPQEDGRLFTITNKHLVGPDTPPDMDQAQA